ncbi:hypothetical protein [Tautonia marina]|uniref:hypothetical protein n=1 Tax=Tautonia marina TaxID=2653855 RepID=UPI0012612D94|nr:hypothetical protein [Tautonia marina]
MNDRTSKVGLIGVILLGLGASGCGDAAGSGNRSPRSDENPAAYEQAIAQAEQTEREAREAEAAALGKAAQSLPEE